MKNRIILCLLVCSIIAFHCIAMESETLTPEKDPLAVLPSESLLDTSILNTVYDHTIQANNDYCHVTHAPFMPLLSGCSGMGKTRVAELLQKELQLLRFNGDDTRNFLKTKNAFNASEPFEVKTGKILRCFSYFVANVHKKLANKAIIFDESIDRQTPPVYDLISKIAKQYGYPQFVIRLVVPKEVAFERIMQREKNIEENIIHYKKHFDTYYNTYEKFDTSVVDYYLENDGAVSYTSLLKTVKTKIAPTNKN